MLRYTEFGFYSYNNFSRQFIVPPYAIENLSKKIAGLEFLQINGVSGEFFSDIMVIPFDVTRQCRFGGNAINFKVNSVFTKLDNIVLANNNTEVTNKKIFIYGGIWKNNYYNMGELKINEATQFTDYGSYTTIRAFLPYFGWVDLPTDELLGKYLQIRLLIDYVSGDGIYYIGVSNMSLIGTKMDSAIKFISSYTCKIGYSIPITRTNKVEINRNNALTAVKTVVSLVTQGYVNLFGGTNTTTTKTTSRATKPKTIVREALNKKTNTFYTKSKDTTTPAKTITTTKSSSDYSRTDRVETAKTISSAIQQSATAVSNSKIKAVSDRTNNTILMNNIVKKVIIEITKPKMIEYSKPDEEQYAHLYGYPLGEIRKLSTLEGYTEISNIHVENINLNSCLDEELAILKNSLLNGVIL